MEKQEIIFEECGVCGYLHKSTWWGDCRKDSERFTFGELPENVYIKFLEDIIVLLITIKV